MKITASVVSRLLGKTEKRFADVFERGGHTLHAGFKVIQPEPWSKFHGTEVYVRYMGGKPGAYRTTMLDHYSDLLTEAGYTVERRHDTLYLTKEN
jgi:hypothetical protein